MLNGRNGFLIKALQQSSVWWSPLNLYSHYLHGIRALRALFFIFEDRLALRAVHICARHLPKAREDSSTLSLA